jgi:hypothetical protein
MGKSRIIPIVIEFGKIPGFHITPMAWNSKVHGKPTTENIQRYVRTFIDSQKVGEPNFGIAQTIIVPNDAQVYKQTKNGRTLLATWKAPMFMAI